MESNSEATGHHIHKSTFYKHNVGRYIIAKEILFDWNHTNKSKVNSKRNKVLNEDLIACFGCLQTQSEIFTGLERETNRNNA